MKGGHSDGVRENLLRALVRASAGPERAWRVDMAC